MYREVSKWLKLQGMPVSENYLRLRLESHPYYPSLIAIQDTLEELGIPCNAFETNKEELKKSQKHFLAHLKFNEGHIAYFPDLETALTKVKRFDTFWSGVVLFATKTKNYGNPEHNRQFNQEKLQRFFGLFSIALVSASLLWLTTFATPLQFLLILMNATGLYFSGLIVQKELGISNSLSDKICGLAKGSSCEGILFARGSKLFNWLSWGDTGLLYFLTSILFMVYALMGQNQGVFRFYYLQSFLGLLFPFYSIYFQWKVVKQWCVLCLAILTVLILNAIISFFLVQTPFEVYNMLVKSAIIFTGIGLFVLFTWQILKRLLKKSFASLSLEIKNASMKRNPDIFNGLMIKEEVNPVNLPESDEAIQFGNAEAPYRIVMACSPFCGPCAKAHQAIETLYKKFPEYLSVSLRFSLKENDDSDTKVVIAKEIINAAKTKPFEAVKDWYTLFDLDKFRQKYHTNAAKDDLSGQVPYVNTIIEKHIVWSKETAIKSTPTFFVNGKKLPEMYSWKDFADILEFEIQK